MARAWLNGRLLELPGDAGSAGLSADSRSAGDDVPAIQAADRGFLLGDGLFETMRAYGGHVFRLRDHLARLGAGLERVGIEVPYDLEGAVLETLAANDGVGDSALRLTVTRGAGGLGLLPPAASPATVLVTARPYHPDPGWYDHGIGADWARGRLDEQRATAGLKQLGYLEAILAVREAAAAGLDDALFLDSVGHVAEAAASNVFLVVGHALRTPPLACGVLPGITRATVLELAPARGLELREEPTYPRVLHDASEAFLTSSLRELVPLVRVGDRTIGNGRPGPVTLRLLEDYRRLAGSPAEGAP